MSDYLARLVSRAQNQVMGEIAAAGAAPPAGRQADTGLDDPFETIGEPEPPVWPATVREQPPAAETRPDALETPTPPPTPAISPPPASPLPDDVPSFR